MKQKNLTIEEISQYLNDISKIDMQSVCEKYIFIWNDSESPQRNIRSLAEIIHNRNNDVEQKNLTKGKGAYSRTVSTLLEVSEKSYYRWKSKDHIKLIDLIEKYYSVDDLNEFLETGKIEKQELVKNISQSDLESVKIMKNNMILNEINQKKVMYH